MALSSPWQRIAVLGIVLGFLAIVALAFGGVVISLSDANSERFAHWLDDHLDELWKGLAVGAPAVATYLFGRRAGRHVGKTEAYTSAIATVRDKQTPDQVVAALKDEARGHGLAVPP